MADTVLKLLLPHFMSLSQKLLFSFKDEALKAQRASVNSPRSQSLNVTKSEFKSKTIRIQRPGSYASRYIATYLLFMTS